MKKVIYGILTFVTTGLLISHVFGVSAASNHFPSGNNGTVKIHEGDTEDESVVNNEPHVCTFHIHFFFSDPTQVGDWSVQSWPPTGNKTTVLTGDYDTSATGEYRTVVYSLNDGHYQLNWEGRDDNNQKHKTFWVECGDNETPTPTGTQNPSPTLEATPTPTTIPTPTLSECDGACFNTGGGDTSTPTESPTATPTPTATLTPTISPSVTVTPTPESNNSGSSSNTSPNNSSNNSSNNGQVLGTSIGPTQGVLGASTLASTGSFAQTFNIYILYVGLFLMGLSTLLYAQKKGN